MKNVAYYHAYLDDLCNWGGIFTEQMKAMEDSNLLPEIDTMKITAITQNDQRMQFFNDLCSQYKVKTEITFLQNLYPNDREMLNSWGNLSANTKNLSETFTLNKLRNDCLSEDMNVLYFHMKGITATINNLLVPGRMSKYRNRYNWRQFLNWGVLTRWEDCTVALNNGYDVAGADYSEDPCMHFRGNFWWAKSDHIRKLPDPNDTEWWVKRKQELNNAWFNNAADRFKDEQWICVLPETKAFNVKSNTTEYIDNDI